MNTVTQMKFLDELADLLDKYKLAVCSRPIKKNPNYSEVFFQHVDENAKTTNIKTNRCHSSGYELRLIKSDLVTDLERQLYDLRDKIHSFGG